MTVKGDSYIFAYTTAYKNMLCVYYYIDFGILFVQVLPFLPGPLVPSFLDGCTFPEKLGSGGGSQRCCNDWVCYLLLCSLPYPSPEDVNGSCFSFFFSILFYALGFTCTVQIRSPLSLPYPISSFLLFSTSRERRPPEFLLGWPWTLLEALSIL